jgi:hypothetical protein
VLTERIQLWRDKLSHLEQVREAGGATLASETDARAEINDAEMALAEVAEQDAEIDTARGAATSDLRIVVAHLEFLDRARNAPTTSVDAGPDAGYVLHAAAAGVVQHVHATQGALVPEGEALLTTIAPQELRFVAEALQSDLGRLAPGLPVRIVAPHDQPHEPDGAMVGALALGPVADGNRRTLELVVRPDTIAPWARAGVVAQLEVTTAGGSEELAIPASAILRDGTAAVIFRRDPKDPARAIRLEADLGLSDGSWTVIASGVREGDEVVVAGNYQLMLATSGSAPKGGHFHADGTFHEGDH